MLEIIFKRFFRKSKKGTISSAVRIKSYGGQTTVNYKTKQKGFLIYNPNNYLRSSSNKKLKYSQRKMENSKGCSSEKERKVNALALRADEGRDYLR